MWIASVKGLSFIIEWGSPLKKEGKNFESKYNHDVKVKSLKQRSTLVQFLTLKKKKFKNKNKVRKVRNMLKMHNSSK